MSASGGSSFAPSRGERTPAHTADAGDAGDAASVAGALQELLGADHVQSGAAALGPFRLQGLLPQAIAYPESPEQTAEVLKLATARNWGVVPWGAGSWLDTGRPPRRYHVALSLSRLNRVLDHDAENLTCSAQAGLGLDEAFRQLRHRHQGLGLGVPGETHTLGGLVAANRTPPLRLLYGEVRDQILALQVALPDGRLVRYGRKVLKNVAGYDMNKLFIGSEGQLGVITEITAKLFPLPDEQGHLCGQFAEAEDALSCAATLLRSPLQPARLVLLAGLAAQAFQGRAGLPPIRAALHLLVSFEGRGAALRRQLADAGRAMMQHLAPETTVLASIPADAERVLERPIQALAAQPASAPTAVRFRLGAEATALGGLLAEVRAMAQSRNLPWAAVADYGCARLACAMAAPAPEHAAALADELSALRAKLEPGRGYLVLQGGPPPVLERLSPWGEMGGELDLMRLLKSRFDPAGTMAPGRFL